MSNLQLKEQLVYFKKPLAIARFRLPITNLLIANCQLLIEIPHCCENK
jgi:hypothetical protein